MSSVVGYLFGRLLMLLLTQGPASSRPRTERIRPVDTRLTRRFDGEEHFSPPVGLWHAPQPSA